MTGGRLVHPRASEVLIFTLFWTSELCDTFNSCIKHKEYSMSDFIAYVCLFQCILKISNTLLSTYLNLSTIHKLNFEFFLLQHLKDNFHKACYICVPHFSLFI